MAEEDLIFGKNRHFFGGIEPSNMIAFSGEMHDNYVSITAHLPNDTVIDGQTLCTVAGAVIRRKATDYPKDEFDGDLVATVTSSTSFSDSGITPNGTYYYSAFPFTEQGVYNRNKRNRFVVNEPNAMTRFTAVSNYDSITQTAKVKIDAALPAGVAGAMIRKSAVSYPLNENDGEEFKNITASGVYYDEDVEIGSTYYYSAFPYTSTGAYNRNESNRVSVIVTASVEPPKPEYGYLYGFDIDLDDPNPITRVSYPSDVDNYNFTPVSQKGSGSFNYGSWPSEYGSGFMPRPCVLNSDFSVNCYLNPNDFSKKEDGSSSSDLLEDSVHYDIMIEWPKIYTKRTVASGVYSFRCSDTKIDDDYECWCNYDANNNEIDHFYTSAYPAAYFGSDYKSTHRAPTPEVYSDVVDILSALHDSEKTVFMFSDFSLILDLLIMMSKSTDLGTVYNAGSNTSDIAGSLDKLGMFYTYPSMTGSTKVFGMENLFMFPNNSSVWVAGLSSSKTEELRRNVLVKVTLGTKDGSTTTNFRTENFSKFIKIPTYSLDNLNLYVKSYDTVKSYGRLVTSEASGNGSSSTYECTRVRSTSAIANYTCLAIKKSQTYNNLEFIFMECNTSGEGYVHLSIKPKAVK